jgi:PAS domain S-box-containing protein
MIDANARTLYVSERMAQMLGYTVQELQGRPVLDFMDEAAHADSLVNWERLKQGISARTDRRFRRKDGSAFWALLSSKPIFGERGEFLGGLAMLTDITERKQAEARAAFLASALAQALNAVRQAHDKLERSVQERTAELSRTSRELRQNREELRALSASVITAQEAERRRIARELHDDTNQTLAMLAVEVDTLQREFPRGEIGDRLRTLGCRLGELSEDVRQLAHQLHPSILDDLGLSVALRSHIRELARREGRRIAFSSRNLPRHLPAPLASCLYRVALEALRNALKHAGPAQIAVSLSGSKKAIGLTVTDTGVGFDPSALKGGPALGMVSMQERVRLVNGTLWLTSQPGRGTRVRAKVPLPRDGS